MTLQRAAVVAASLGVALAQAGCCCDSAYRVLMSDSCRDKQASGIATLRLLGDVERRYRESSGRYGDAAEIAFEPPGDGGYYRYVLVEVDDAHFVAEARGYGGHSGMEGDLWRIDETQFAPAAVRDICAELEK